MDRSVFPIMDGKFIRGIPLDMIAAHEEQAKRNHGGQNLAGLSRRGGLSPCEAIAVLEDRSWTPYRNAEWELIRRLGTAKPEPEDG